MMFVSLWSEASWAMRCPSTPLKEVYEAADVVVAGVVTDIKNTMLEDGKSEASLYTVQVLKSWKRDTPISINILAQADISGYKLELHRDRNYIIFLPSHKTGISYSSNACTPHEDLGEKNGYFISMLLDEMAEGVNHSPNFIGYQKRTPENTFIGTGWGLPDDEIMRRENELLGQ